MSPATPPAAGSSRRRQMKVLCLVVLAAGAIAAGIGCETAGWSRGTQGSPTVHWTPDDWMRHPQAWALAQGGAAFGRGPLPQGANRLGSKRPVNRPRRSGAGPGWDTPASFWYRSRAWSWPEPTNPPRRSRTFARRLRAARRPIRRSQRPWRGSISAPFDCARPTRSWTAGRARCPTTVAPTCCGPRSTCGTMPLPRWSSHAIARRCRARSRPRQGAARAGRAAPILAPS